ncbi:uncharacterized protein B0I36DRAFT_311662 [Microdochium trichocladiopsis]|uniref:Uncharacterized protein n=1 Tax=Microdochium trichocladiopsis TaxID=1682393 RepID=A0A9P8YI77_9PEZI|nr:uncharacterized protein B0I36DRAFT_311662 [Microdochium trichocladiopsis]KAH7040864.1 hypothetical protein B0I36DRAFT_311662 [Microdochium trichocladiopsis]
MVPWRAGFAIIMTPAARAFPRRRLWSLTRGGQTGRTPVVNPWLEPTATPGHPLATASHTNTEQNTLVVRGFSFSQPVMRRLATLGKHCRVMVCLLEAPSRIMPHPALTGNSPGLSSWPRGVAPPPSQASDAWQRS